jgi:hypothetical protein
MSNEKESETKTRFPTFRRLFTWKMARRALIVFATLSTLAGVFYAEENFRGKRAWDKYRAELEAQGVQLDMAAFVPPQVPNEDNFCMTPLLAPLFDFNPPGSASGRFRDTNGFARAYSVSLYRPLGPAPNLNGVYWHGGGRAELSAWQDHFRSSTNYPSPEAVGTVGEDVLFALGKFEKELTELSEASRRPYARANLNYDTKNPASISIPHYAVIRNCAQILELRAVARLSLARSDEALEDLRLMFYLSDTVSDDLFMISQLVRIANLTQCLRVVWEGLSDHRWSDAQLAAIERQLSSIDLLAAMKRALQSEEAFGDKLIHLLQREPELLPQLTYDMDQLWSGADAGGARKFLFKLIPSGWYSFERKNYHIAFQKLGLTGGQDLAVRIDPRQFESNWRDMEDYIVKDPAWRLIRKHRVMSAILMPSLGGVPIKFTIGQNHRNLALLACALERHRLAKGSYPETLSELAPDWVAEIPNDPLTGEHLKYRRLEGGRFDLYSVGWNLEDDGGEPGLRNPNPEKPDYRKGDWVWRYPR